MTTDYITLAQLKEHLSLNADDNELDATLSRCITAASRAIDALAGRCFYVSDTTSARTYRPDDSRTVFTHDIASTTGLVVKTDDDFDGVYETTRSSYQVSPVNVGDRPYTRIELLGSDYFYLSGDARRTVEVTATWGWPAVPTQVEQATLILAARYYKRKDSPEGILGFGDLGAIRITPTDRDVHALIMPLRKLVVV